MVTYPGLPVPEIHAVLDRATSAGRYAPGVDVPDRPDHAVRQHGHLHGQPVPSLGGRPGSRRAAARAPGRPARGQDRRHGSGSPAVDADAFRPQELAGRAVLVHTGFDRFWRTDAYLHANPFLTLEAVELLAAAGVALVGIDSLNIDSTDDPERPAHSILLRAGIPIVEHMTEPRGHPCRGRAVHGDPGADPRNRHVPGQGDRGPPRRRVGNAQGPRATGTDGACGSPDPAGRFAAPPAQRTVTPDAEPPPIQLAPVRARGPRRRLAARDGPAGERRWPRQDGSSTTTGRGMRARSRPWPGPGS